MHEPSKLEAEFAFQVRAYRLPEPVREYRFAAEAFSRQWRWDFCWQRYLLAVELHGLVVERMQARSVVRGGHGTVPGMIRDMDKLNAGVLLGWSCLVFTQSHVKSGAAIQMTHRALVVKGWAP